MEIPEVVAHGRDAITVKRVYGDPYEKDGSTVIPAAKVQGVVGGGAGEGPDQQGSGTGGGFAVNARPVGAYVIRGGDVSWQPAMDLNRIILGGQIVAVVLLLVVRSIVKARRQA